MKLVNVYVVGVLYGVAGAASAATCIEIKREGFYSERSVRVNMQQTARLWADDLHKISNVDVRYLQNLHNVNLHADGDGDEVFDEEPEYQQLFGMHEITVDDLRMEHIEHLDNIL